MWEIVKLYESNKFIILIFTVILFIIGLYIGMSEILIYALNFLLLMEIVRTIVEYVIDDSHRIKMRYIIDSAIVFGIREIFVAWLMLKSDLLIGGSLMLISFIGTYLLLRFRKRIIETSPDILEKNIKEK